MILFVLMTFKQFYRFMNNEFTKHQIEIMQHTISEPNRNWFATGKNTFDAHQFEILVEGGFATREQAPQWAVDDVIYRLTEKGKLIVRSIKN